MQNDDDDTNIISLLSDASSVPMDQGNLGASVHTEAEDAVAAQYATLDAGNTAEQGTKRFRHWVFTLHQPTPSTQEMWNTYRDNLTSTSTIKYAIIGDEVCPTTGNRHWQGYLSLRDGKTWSAVRTFVGYGFNGAAWCRAARGTPQQNRAYCSKEAVVYELGQCPRHQQGKRSDLEALTYELVQDGSINVKRHRDAGNFKLLSSYVRYRQHLTNASEDFRDQREHQPEVIWCLGPTGAGKSHWIYSTFPNAWWCPPKGPSGLWYDNYDGHDVAVFDDFRSDHMTFSMLLRICDRFPMHVPVKGSTRKFIASTIIFTCPDHPKEVYVGSSENIWQLLRRISRLITFKAFTDGRLGGEIEKEVSLKEEFILARSEGRMPEAFANQNNINFGN